MNHRPDAVDQPAAARRMPAWRRWRAATLRLVSKAGPTGDRYNVPCGAAARCLAYLLLAAAEHPTDGKVSDAMPSVTRRPKTEQVELGLWGSPPIPRAVRSPSTARRLAHGLLAALRLRALVLVEWVDSSRCPIDWTHTAMVIPQCAVFEDHESPDPEQRMLCLTDGELGDCA